MRFIDIKTDGGTVKGKIAFYCDALDVTRQGFYWYLKHRDNPWKYEDIAEKMRGIVAGDECNDTYGRCRMYQALKLKYPDEDISGERTVYRIMEEIGLYFQRIHDHLVFRLSPNQLIILKLLKQPDMLPPFSRKSVL